MQVADSICCSLINYPDIDFVVVLSHYFKETKERLIRQKSPNLEIVDYTIGRNPWLLLTGRDKFLDNLVKQKKIDCVLSVFGPILWVPRCRHVSGFARPHIVIPDSPYFSRMGKLSLLKERIHNKILLFYFKRTSRIYFTENPFITKRLAVLMPRSKVVTITNFYNQVYDHKELWNYLKLPPFAGNTLLTVSNYYPHKNLGIILDILPILEEKYGVKNIRFILTIDKSSYPTVPDKYKNNILFTGTVDISVCPSLYEQADIVFQPTLLECFSVTYAEAMRMQKPLITTNLEFAKGLCGDAAIYYDATSAEEAAKTIWEVISQDDLKKELVKKGLEQIKTFDSYDDRVEKILNLCTSKE